MDPLTLTQYVAAASILGLTLLGVREFRRLIAALRTLPEDVE